MTRDTFSIKVTGSAAKAFQRLAAARGSGSAKVNELVLETFRKQALIAAGHVVRTQLSGTGSLRSKRGRFKVRKQRRTGNLARSIEGRALMLSGSPAIQVGILRGPALGYAGIQEFGTKKYNPDSPYKTIRPKSSKYLAFPVSSKVLTPAGVARYSGPRTFPQKLSPLIFDRPKGKRNNVAGSLVLASQLKKIRQRAILHKRPPDYSQLDAIYLLLLSLDIRPGFFLTDGFQDYIPQIAEAIARAFVEKFLGE